MLLACQVYKLVWLVGDLVGERVTLTINLSHVLPIFVILHITVVFVELAHFNLGVGLFTLRCSAKSMT